MLGQQLQYPKTKKIDHTDDYHGTIVPDPYRWLEQDVRTSPEVRDWVDAENKVTFAYLEKLPGRDAITERLTKLWNYEKRSTPFKAGGRYYFTKNDGLQNQSVVYVQNSLAEEPRVLIDPNTWSKDGTVALGGMAFSNDGRYVAYAVADAGSDWRTWHVMEIDGGKVLPDELHWSKFSGADWSGDSRGFFYGRYPAPSQQAEFQSLNKNMKIYYHRVGTPQSEDYVVYERPDQPEWGFEPTVTEDGRYLIITVSKGTDARYQVYYKDLREANAGAVTLVGAFDNEYSFIGNDGPVFYFKTDLDAPRGRVISMDVRNPEPANWKEIIPQQEATLEGVSYVGGLLTAEYLQDAKSRVRIFTTSGKSVRDVDLGGIGSVNGFGGKRSDPETFYSFQSFTTPPTIYRYDVATGEKSVFYKTRVDFDPNQYVVEQVFYHSKDGTKVPMFLAHRKGLKLDGNNPTLLYGYGGFDISLTPSFSITRLVWLQMGGVLAIPNLRGGGEYGQAWHKAGTKLQKQNVFDDFIAAAQWLIDNHYTRPAKLAIQGGSNGGLLVGATMTQRPELFGAALPAVGVMDMLRFQKFTAGRFWVDDYGSSDNPEEFKALYAYSPYHNLKPGTRYPATLVTTADHDDRVVPGHSFKFAARLQEDQAGDAPVLIRIETRAGHGAGKPTRKIIEETADAWSFLAKNLGMTLPKGF
ncbi:MAG: prolyl oligopeptidase family serine peptidase [Thermoanaerobaculia bacterium]